MKHLKLDLHTRTETRKSEAHSHKISKYQIHNWQNLGSVCITLENETADQSVLIGNIKITDRVASSCRKCKEPRSSMLIWSFCFLMCCEPVTLRYKTRWRFSTQVVKKKNASNECCCVARKHAEWRASGDLTFRKHDCNLQHKDNAECSSAP